jgi:hypothetical protein
LIASYDKESLLLLKKIVKMAKEESNLIYTLLAAMLKKEFEEHNSILKSKKLVFTMLQAFLNRKITEEEKNYL